MTTPTADAPLLAGVFEACPVPMLTFDATMRCAACNPAAAQALGRAASDVVGRPVVDAALHRRALAGESFVASGVALALDGAPCGAWWDLSFAPVRGAGNEVVGAVATLAPSTRRERETLRTAIDAGPVGLLAFDTQLRITEWNARAEQTSGLRRADVIGRPLLEVHPDLAGTQILREYERALAGETVRVYGRWYEGPLTERRCYDVVFAPVRDADGAVVGGVMLALDVTARADAVRSLRDERAFLRSLIDTSPSSIVAFDRDLRQTEWNYRAERNTGIRREDAIGRTTEELYPGFVGSDWHRLVQRVLDGEWLHGLDFALVDPATGEPLVLDVTMAPLFDANRAVVGALVMSLDVTERVRAQRALEESEARYRHLFEHSAVAQVLIDVATSDVVGANAAAVRLLGYDLDVLVGMPLRRVRLAPDAHAGGDAPETGHPNGRCLYRTASGTTVVVDAIATVVTRDGRRVAHVLLIDVTARVRAEAERDRLIGIVEATTDLVATGDPETRSLTYLNRAGRELLGIGPDERTLAMAEIVCEEDHALAFDMVMPHVLRGGTWRGELRLRARDGRAIPTSIVVLAQPAAPGRPPALAAIVRDITMEKAREGELTAAREAAERASGAKSAFLAGMSHELRTPLGAVLGFAELLRDGRAGALTPTQAEYVEDVLVGARQLRAIVDDALDLARIEAGVIDVRPRRVDVRALVEDAVVTVGPLAAERGVRVDWAVSDDASRVVADAARLRQVLVNFLTNAIKFNRRGGRARVEVTAAPPARVRFTVRDTGRGIAADDLPRLFVEFQRLGVRDEPGSGLGLAITRRIVEAMGGAVEVESEPGVGSVFHAVVPRAPAEAAGATGAGTAGAAAT